MTGFTVGCSELGGNVCWHLCLLFWAADLLSVKPHMPGLYPGAKSYKKVCVVERERTPKPMQIKRGLKELARLQAPGSLPWEISSGFGNRQV